MSASIWRFTVCCLLFLLLREWMLPLTGLSHLTDLYVLQPLLLAAACFIICDMLRLPHWSGWPIKLMASFSIIAHYFQQQTLFSIDWWLTYMTIVREDLSQLLHGGLLLSAENRTLIFLIGLALLISVVVQLMLTWQMGGYFVIATLVYLTALQMLAGLDMSAGIMRVMAYGLLLQFVLHIARIQRVFQIRHFPAVAGMRWLWAALLISSLTWGAGAGLSHAVGTDKLAPDWQAMTWFEDLSSRIPQPHQALMSSGYGGETERLGGKITMDESIAFIAQTADRVYWRGTSKHYYTGQGWRDAVQEEDTQIAQMFDDALQLPDRLPDRVRHLAQNIVGLEQNPEHQAYLIEDFLRMNYKYSLDETEIPPDGHDFVDHFLFEQSLGYCDHFSTAMVVMLRTLGIPARWVVGYAEGEPSLLTYEQLKADILDWTKHHPPAWLEAVPAPRLTHSIDIYTMNDRNDTNDQVIAGQFLERNPIDQQATYDSSDMPSVSMVIDGANANELYNVIVRQSHAHSWVEAYLPEVGWQAFEPTPGIASDYTLSEQGGDAAIEQEASNQQPLLQNLQWQRLLDSISVGSWFNNLAEGGIKEQIVQSLNDTQNRWQERWVDGERGRLIIQIVTLIVFLCALVYIVKSKRVKARWQLWKQLKRLQRSEQEGQASMKLFEGLWLRLFHRYGELCPTQTMREYVNTLHLTTAAKREALHHFLELYEAARYNEPQHEPSSKSYIMQVWRKIR